MSAEIMAGAVDEILAEYTRPELIVPCLRATDPLGMVEELSQCLRGQEIIGDLFSFYHAAVNHEFLSPSALRSGIAIPHARSSHVRRLTMAVGRARQPVLWGGREALPVDLVFLLAVPATAAEEHLALLSGIAGLANQTGMLHRLRTSPDARGMFEVLRAFPKTAS